MEHPDFMKEIVSAARIGRTLGVHLLLTTPSSSGRGRLPSISQATTSRSSAPPRWARRRYYRRLS
jgi:DNA segregation ATPase FtsK/SpoIIIE-like protein